VPEPAVVTSSPSLLVLIDGLAGTHPVESCSLMMVLATVGAQPVLCMVSADSNTLSAAIVFGVSRMISRNGALLFCSREMFAVRVLLFPLLFSPSGYV